MKKYPVSKPYITDLEKKYVTDVLDSGLLSLGPRYQKFEKKFAKITGTKYACAVSNGTAGLHLAMISAKIGSGDEVITTPFSFVASANCIEYVGAKPIFVDIDPITYNIDPTKIEKQITKKTRAILVVHIFGQPADMNPIIKIAKKHKLHIIEDACESLNAKYKGNKVGTFGQSAVFAFYPNKQITTGEGGMIVTDDIKIYELCCSLRNQGRTPNMQWLDHKYLGYNYRMDEMSAAVGLAQLEKIDFLISEKAKIADRYTKHLAKYQDIVASPAVALGNTHTWFVYVIKILDKVKDRDKIINQLSKKGISTKPYLPSIHLFDYYRTKYGFKKGDFPLSEEISTYALALPFYIGLQEEDVKHIIKNVINTIQHK